MKKIILLATMCSFLIFQLSCSKTGDDDSAVSPVIGALEVVLSGFGDSASGEAISTASVRDVSAQGKPVFKVPKNPQIFFVSSAVLNEATLNKENVLIVDTRTNVRVDSEITMGEDQRSFSLTPLEPLEPDVLYVVRITTRLKGNDGSGFPSKVEVNLKTAGGLFKLHMVVTRPLLLDDKTHVVINEAVIDPQQDWDDSKEGNNIAFDSIVGSGLVDSNDQWVEIYNASDQALKIKDWTLVMREQGDSSSDKVLCKFGAVDSCKEIYSKKGSALALKGGEYLILSRFQSVISDSDVELLLINQHSDLEDEIKIEDARAYDLSDEAVSRNTSGISLGAKDIVQMPATISEAHSSAKMGIGDQVFVRIFGIDEEGFKVSLQDVQLEGFSKDDVELTKLSESLFLFKAKKAKAFGLIAKSDSLEAFADINVTGAREPVSEAPVTKEPEVIEEPVKPVIEAPVGGPADDGSTQDSSDRFTAPELPISMKQACASLEVLDVPGGEAPYHEDMACSRDDGSYLLVAKDIDIPEGCRTRFKEMTDAISAIPANLIKPLIIEVQDNETYQIKKPLAGILNGPQSPLIIRARSSFRPKLIGFKYNNREHALRIGISNVVLHGFLVETRRYGFSMGDRKGNITVQNNYFKNTNQAVYSARAVGEVIVQNNCFHEVSTALNIDSYASGKRVFKDNILNKINTVISISFRRGSTLSYISGNKVLSFHPLGGRFFFSGGLDLPAEEPRKFLVDRLIKAKFIESDKNEIACGPNDLMFVYQRKIAEFFSLEQWKKETGLDQNTACGDGSVQPLPPPDIPDIVDVPDVDPTPVPGDDPIAMIPTPIPTPPVIIVFPPTSAHDVSQEELDGIDFDRLNLIYGLAFDKENNLYFASYGDHKVFKLDAASGAVSVVLESVDILGSRHMITPLGLTFDADGFLYIADAENHKVFKMNLNTNAVEIVDAGLLSTPQDLVFDQNGVLVIANSHGNSIKKVEFLSDGQTSVSDIFKLSSGGLLTGVAVDHSNKVWFTSYLNHKVYRGQEEFSSNQQHNLFNPTAIVFGPKGTSLVNNVYVADSLNDRVLEFPVAGGAFKVVAGAQGRGDGPGQLHYPRALAFDKNGDLFIADAENNRIIKVQLK